MSRSFEFKPAVRDRVPLLIGIVGPSGTGKTYSALRLAKGIQRVTGGAIKVIDTEHKRALHYADRFEFEHMDFRQPFASLDYLAAIQAAAATPGPIVVDSMSHEHDGPGGYLECHEAEVQRLVQKCGFQNEFAASVPAWARPAEYRRKLVQGIIHAGVNAIFCFRAKEKVDMEAKKKDGSRTVGKLGWMPIAGDTFVFEMTLKCLLLPGADGVPTWHPDELGEKAMCKLPIQFRETFKQSRQLSEDIGEELARWAAGTPASSPFSDLLKSYDACQSREQFDAAEKARESLWPKLAAADKQKAKAASQAAAKRLPAAEKEQRREKPDDHIPGVDDPDRDRELFNNQGGIPH